LTSLKYIKSKSNDVATDTEDATEREKLLKLFVQRIQQNLLNLNKFLPTSSKKQSAGKSCDWAKNLYSKSLKLTVNGPMHQLVSELCDLIEDLKNEIQKLK